MSEMENWIETGDSQEEAARCEPLPNPDWREATLRRLESWIEERERMIVAIDRRIAEEANAACLRRAGLLLSE